MDLGAATVPDDDPAPAKEGVCSRPVDLVHLARYTLGNRALEREVLELFLRQSLAHLERLESAALSEKAWLEAAHTIKGSARAVGAWKVANLAEAAERLPQDAGAERRAQVIGAVAAEIDAANRYIEGLFAET
jgi:HPt (histidine-containing phosphotransfer) domain-containing protein